jgi:hypothetical protein
MEIHGNEMFMKTKVSHGNKWISWSSKMDAPEVCDEDTIVLDTENLNKSKLHLLFWVVFQNDFVDSDDDEDAEGMKYYRCTLTNCYLMNW